MPAPKNTPHIEVVTDELHQVLRFIPSRLLCKTPCTLTSFGLYKLNPDGDGADLLQRIYAATDEETAKVFRGEVVIKPANWLQARHVRDGVLTAIRQWFGRDWIDCQVTDRTERTDVRFDYGQRFVLGPFRAHNC